MYACLENCVCISLLSPLPRQSTFIQKVDGPSLFYRGNVIPVAKSGTENKNDTQINGYMLMK